MKKSIIYACLIFIFISCEKDKPKIVDGKNTYLKPEWKSQYTTKIFSDISMPEGSFSYKNLALLMYIGKEKQELRAVDIYTGKTKWTFSDWFLENEGLSSLRLIKKEGIIHWVRGGRHYWLDGDTGQLKKKYRQKNSIDRDIYLLKNRLYGIGTPKDTLTQYRSHFIFGSNFYERPMKRLLMPPTDTIPSKVSNWIGGFTGFIPLVEDNKTYISGVYSRIISPGKIVNEEIESYLGLYNLTDEKWEYKDVKLNEMHWKGVVYNGLLKHKQTIIGNIRNSIICYNYMTGKKVWEREYPHDFSFSGLVLADGILIGSCENKTLYGINPDTGVTLWTAQGAGTASQLEGRVLNGVLYYTGGRFIRAYDITNGNILWELDSEKYEKNNAYWDVWGLWVVPGKDGKKGRVIAANAKNYYAFEAAR